MDSLRKHSRLSFTEFLAFEEQSEFKNEFYQGEIVAMSGGTTNHNLISSNINGEIRQGLKGTQCYAYSSDQMVRGEKADSGFYPDVSVVCGPPAWWQGKKHVVTNPTVIVEVLSKSTIGRDLRSKFRMYKLFPSLEEYVVAEQNEAQVDVFRRTESGLWEVEEFQGLETTVELKSISVSIPMQEIYDGVIWE